MAKLFHYPEDEQNIKKICSMFDYTEALNPNCTSQDIIKACEVAKRYGLCAVSVYPTWAKLAAEQLAGSNTLPQVAIGFPHGSTTMEAKLGETKQALEDGAKEIDMVINIARFFDGDYDYVKNEIASVVKLSAEYGVKVKAILEVGYLTTEQIYKLTDLAIEAGVDFIKTCTGFGPGRANMNNVAAMVNAANGRCKVKTTGFVPSLEDMWAFIEMGASRVAGRGFVVDQLRRIGYDLG